MKDERHPVRSGVWLVTFGFSVSRKEQRRRFRELDPLIVGRAHVVYEKGDRPGAGVVL